MKKKEKRHHCSEFYKQEKNWSNCSNLHQYLHETSRMAMA